MSTDVALVTPYPASGSTHAGESGVASYSANLARALSGSGLSVTVVAPAGRGDDGTPDRPRLMSRDVDPLATGRVDVLRVPTRGETALLSLMSAARATGAPIIHLQHEFFLYGGALSASLLGPALASGHRRHKVVVTMHQVVDPHSVDAAWVRMHRTRVPVAAARAGMAATNLLASRAADRVIVHEPGLAEILDSTWIPHVIEPVKTVDRDQARAALELDGRFVVLCFGFLAPYKGLEVALAAAERVGDRLLLVVAGGEHPRLAGRDPYAERLRARWGHVARFTGRVPEEDIPHWFSAADLALFCYPRPFSSSGALALALAHQTPVLLSPEMARVCGAPTQLSTPLDADALAARLGDLAATPEHVTQLSEEAEWMTSGRSWPDVARRHAETYLDLLGAGGHRRAGQRRLGTGPPCPPEDVSLPHNLKLPVPATTVEQPWHARITVVTGELTGFSRTEHRGGISVGRAVATAARSQIQRRPVAAVGLGVEAPRGLADRVGLRTLARLSDVLVVRDEPTAQAFAAAGVREPFRVGADITWGLLADVPAAPDVVCNGALVVVPESPPSDFARLIGRAMHSWGQPVERHRLCPWGRSGAGARLLRAVFGLDMEVTDPPVDLAGARDLFATSRVVVTGSPAAVVAAASAGVPLVAVSREPRVVELAEMLEQPIVTPDGDPDQLVVALQRAERQGHPRPDLVRSLTQAAESELGLLALLASGGQSLDLTRSIDLPLWPESWWTR
ncbi:MAG: glycosyltransferase [Nocardioidaceae bacterium]